MDGRMYLTAKDVSEIVGVSLGKAYEMIRKMNKELQEANYITVSGKVPTAYFKKKWYGYDSAAGE